MLTRNNMLDIRAIQDELARFADRLNDILEDGHERLGHLYDSCNASMDELEEHRKRLEALEDVLSNLKEAYGELSRI